MKPVYLRPGGERRLVRGHRWVFNNEIADPLSDYEPGSWVRVFSSKGHPFGVGYINPHSLIAVRLVSASDREPDRAFFAAHLRRALARRNDQLYPGSSCYRVVFGESDGLPGLVVDRYDTIVVYQITTLGMSRREEWIQELLIELLQPEALVQRNDSRMRSLEGLPLARAVVFGAVPEVHRIDLDGLQLVVDPVRGQKTGMYLDQRDNRGAIDRWAKGRKVLDLFCYNGAWGLAAARAGAVEVVGVDSSGEALNQARHNAKCNGLDRVCGFVESEALSYLKAAPKGHFDLIILDPPAFAKSKSALAHAQKGYIDINRRALLALNTGGILITCSCSHHVSEEMFREILIRAAQAGGRQLRILQTGAQAADHPVLLAMPETCYLKCLVLEVI